LNDDEKPRLVADLGSNNFLILRNHGLLTVGATIPDAFIYMYALETACQTQLAAQSAGVALTEINSQIVAGIKEQIEMVTRGMGGGLAWPGLLRKLDRIDPTYRD
jgi:ribulose-5-phosphate 4-epimerase/fuculose-1-phosphate aldolase